MEILALAILSALSGLLGGWLAISRAVKLNLLISFTTGALIGLVTFSLLPEIFELGESSSLGIIWPMSAFAAGFLVLHIVEKFFLVHHAHEDSYASHQHRYVGTASSLAIIAHSFLDGLSIGLAFQINNAVGIAVSLAVIAHRFADGVNIASLMLGSKNSRSAAGKMIAAGAVAPILGALASLMIDIPDDGLLIFLGFFAGFILYIAASDILPQAHSRSSSYKSVLITLVGVLFMFGISQLS